MTDPIKEALHLLGRFWLEEVRPENLKLIAALPELAQALPGLDATVLEQLAVEYQRLFGFNLPPYESIFVDPSVMLAAPATERVQHLYRRAGWQPPAGIRVGAPDHVGLELLALADGLASSQTALTVELHRRHLALWLPPLVLTLRRLKPRPFYEVLGDLTLALILDTLPEDKQGPEIILACARAKPPGRAAPVLPGEAFWKGDDTGENLVGLRDVVQEFLPPCRVGLFLTREDIARMSQALDLPGIMGERARMLENLFRLAGQYDLLPALFEQLDQLLGEVRRAYQTLLEDYPLWKVYADLWLERLGSTQSLLEELRSRAREDLS